MKKVLFSLAFIAATLTSCLTDKPALNYEGNGAVDVTIGINVPELATRAGETGMNSGLGAIDNFSEDEWAKYDLRYIFEVYDVTPGYEDLEKPVKERLVQTFDQYSDTKFELRLIPNRTYKFVVWADFVAEDTNTDLNYNTADLKKITRIGEASAMDECMDAYFIQQDIEVKATHTDNLVLTRPFGKIRVIATDVNEVNIGSTPAKVDVTFYNHPTFVSLNALSGETENTVDKVTYSYTIAKGLPYSEGYDKDAKNQTLFADYIFAQSEGAQEVNFTMTVTDQNKRLIREHDFNTQIPLQRNHLTTIMGNLLTTATEFNVSINDDFNGWYDINYNPDAITLATPEVYTSVEENVVTLYWDAVENADYYTVAYSDETIETTDNMVVIENLEYDTEYTFEVRAYSNDTFNFKASEIATVSVTTEIGVITYEILYTFVSWDQPGEKEIQFWYSDTNAHKIDFKGMNNCVPGQPLAAGYYSSDEDTIDTTYSIFDYGTTNGNMSFVECTVTDNGNGSRTYDAKFVYNGQEYAFVYTSPAEQVEESVNTVELVSKSAGEQIGSYAYGCLLSDAEGNNRVKIAVDQFYSWDSAADFPKANDYAIFQSSPSYISQASHFSFVNKTLMVNGVTYANDAISNAKLTVVEATSITVEFTVDGEDYKFVYTVNENNQGGNVEENTGYKVYARTELGWTYMNIWPWTVDAYGNTVNLAFNESWPGDAMETAVVDGVEYFVYTLPADIQTYNLVFSTNDGTPQTVDFNNCKADRDRFFLITSQTYDNKHIVTEITDNGNEGGEEGGNQGGNEGGSEPVVYDPWTCSYTYTGSPISGATFTLTGTGENQDVIVIESVKAAQIGAWQEVTATRGDVVGSGKAYISYGDYKCYFNVTIGNVTYIGETDALF